MYKRPDRLLFMGNVIRYSNQVVFVLLICISKSTGKPTVNLDADIKKFESKHNIQLNCTTSEIPIPIAAFLLNDASLATTALSKTTCRIGQKECSKEECECGPNFFFYNVTTYLKEPQNTFTCELRFNRRKKDKNVHVSVRASVLHNESGIFILEETKEEKGQVFSKSENGTADSEEREDDGLASSSVALAVVVPAFVLILIVVLRLIFFCAKKKGNTQKNDKRKEPFDIQLALTEDNRHVLPDMGMIPMEKDDKKSDADTFPDVRLGSDLTSVNKDDKESEADTFPDVRLGSDLTSVNKDDKESEEDTVPDIRLGSDLTSTNKDDKESEEKKQDLPEIVAVTIEKEDDKKCEETRNESTEPECISTKNNDVKSEDETDPLLNCNDDSENPKEIEGVFQKQVCTVKTRDIWVKIDSTVNEQLLESYSEQSDCTRYEDDHDFENNNIEEIIDR